MADITLQGITKTFGAVVAIEDVTLACPARKLTVLVGPSGCGKSTLLRLLAGLETPDRGRVGINGQDVTHIPAWARNTAMVFQSYALYPHMTVFKNMAFPLEARGLSKAEIKKQVADTAALLDLTPLLARYPRQLSGGQRQRVAIGRAIVRQPDVFLMDEPLSNLDARLRVETRAEIKRLQRELGITTVYVTHDQAEAMTLADQLVVMRDGRVLQSGPPEELYRYPQQQFVAGFIGNPGMNFIPGHRVDGSFVAEEFACSLPDALSARLATLPEQHGLLLGLRPESIRVCLEPEAEAIPATVVLAEALGKETLLTLTCGAHTLKAYVPPGWSSRGAPPGGAVWLTFDPEAIHLFDAQSEKTVNLP